MVLFRQSKRRVSLCCEKLFGTSISPGLVVKLQNIVTEATRPAYDELVSQLPDQPAVNVDETPTRERNGKAWIWAVVAAQFTVFAVRLSRRNNPEGDVWAAPAATLRSDLPDFGGGDIVSTSVDSGHVPESAGPLRQSVRVHSAPDWHGRTNQQCCGTGAAASCHLEATQLRDAKLRGKPVR